MAAKKKAISKKAPPKKKTAVKKTAPKKKVAAPKQAAKPRVTKGDQFSRLEEKLDAILELLQLPEFAGVLHAAGARQVSTKEKVLVKAETVYQSKPSKQKSNGTSRFRDYQDFALAIGDLGLKLGPNFGVIGQILWDKYKLNDLDKLPQSEWDAFYDEAEGQANG